MEVFSLFLMSHQALTFSEIVTRSYTTTLTLLKTYILGALLLTVASLVFRGIGGGLFALADLPAIKDNLGLFAVLGIIGLGFTIAGVIFQILQSMYALVIAVDHTKHVKAGILKAYRNLWRLILGLIWVMLRSFMWITFLSLPFFIISDTNQSPEMLMIGIALFIAGTVCSFFFMPRLMFTNVIQLKDGKGIRASAELSLQRTHGYWGKIVGNNIFMVLCVGLTSLAMVAVFALLGIAFISGMKSLGAIFIVIVGIPLGLIAFIISMIYFFAMALFMQIYQVELYETIKAHPRAKA